MEGVSRPFGSQVDDFAASPIDSLSSYGVLNIASCIDLLDDYVSGMA